MDDMKMLNVDNKNIKYKMEIKLKNDNFNLVYEGKKDYCNLYNLKQNSTYDIRICSYYNNINSNWTELYQLDTECADSLILNTNRRKREFVNKILQWVGCKSMELLYRGTRDGMTGRNFHNKCDNKGKTICLFLNDKDNIFGGYSSIPWEDDGGSKIAEDCFLFTLTNIHNTEPTKLPYIKGTSVQHIWKYGPVFGGATDLYFGDQDGNFKLDESNGAEFPYSFKDILGKGKSIFTGDKNIKNKYIKLKEIEVFLVS